MKKTNLFFLAILILISTAQSKGQVVMTKDNFSREAGFTDAYIQVDLTTFPLPKEGSNQVWDYSNMITMFESTIEFTAETNNPAFPNALNSFSNNLSFQGLPIPTNVIETVDEEGWAYIGKSVTDISYPIETITGTVGDALRFVGGNSLYDGRINRLQFPLAYQNNWTATRNEFIDFELTVAAFGLDQVPGYDQRIHTHYHEAVGYGTLVIPTLDGTPSAPIAAILLKVVTTSVDSFFVGGAPAPEVLTDAFGLTQGESLLGTQTYYAFYTPGFGSQVLRINVNEAVTEVSSAFYRPAAGKQIMPNFVLNKVDFPRPAGFVEPIFRADPTTLSIPNGGNNQMWDYSTAITTAQLSTVFTDQTNNPAFPNALNSFRSNLTFQGLPTPVDVVETVDEEGWAYIGKLAEDLIYPISFITGGATDSIRFVGGNSLYDGRINRIRFPLTDQSVWTETRIESTPFELTVAAFGLDHLRGEQVRTHTHDHEAIGYGTLRLPTPQGTASKPLEVVLLRVVETAVDSFYLGGALAPEAITNAFGVTQGQDLLLNQTYYAFYTRDFGSHVFRINTNIEETEVTSAVYRLPRSATTALSISHDRVCDVPTAGQSQVTALITGGIPPYQINGNFNGEVDENEAISFVVDDTDGSYIIGVVDAIGSELELVETFLPCTKLPVELLSFSGKAENKGNLLQWKTASELNNHSFAISYAVDGQDFQPLQTIGGKGTASINNKYTFLHQDAPDGRTYYQLSQVDFNGRTKLLGIVSLQRGVIRGAFDVFPTAVKHQLNVSFNLSYVPNNLTLKIYNSSGQLVQNQKMPTAQTVLQLDVGHLPTGSYILQIESEVDRFTSKFVKL